MGSFRKKVINKLLRVRHEMGVMGSALGSTLMQKRSIGLLSKDRPSVITGWRSIRSFRSNFPMVSSFIGCVSSLADRCPVCRAPEYVQFSVDFAF